MNPLDLLRSARPGDTAVVRLRGPATDEELEDTKREMEREYPGVSFVMEDDGDELSVRVKRG